MATDRPSELRSHPSLSLFYSRSLQKCSQDIMVHHLTSLRAHHRNQCYLNVIRATRRKLSAKNNTLCEKVKMIEISGGFWSTFLSFLKCIRRTEGQNVAVQIPSATIFVVKLFETKTATSFWCTWHLCCYLSFLHLQMSNVTNAKEKRRHAVVEKVSGFGFMSI